MAGTNGSNPLFSESPNGILVLDGTGKIADINPAGCEAFGRPLVRLQGTLFSDWVNPGDRRYTETQLGQLFEGETTEWKTRIRRGDGFPRAQQYRGVPLKKNDGVAGAVLFFKGIEDAQGGRPHSKQLLAFMQTLPGQFIITTDKSGKIRFSSGMERTHFRDSSALLGRPYKDLLGGERDGEQNLEDLLGTVGSGKPWAGLQWHRRNAGGSFPARVFATPHRDPMTGQILGAMIVGQDDSASHRWRDQAEKAEPLAQLGSLSTGVAQRIAEALTELEDTLSRLEEGSPGGCGESSIIRAEITKFQRFLEAVAEFGNRGTIRRQPTSLMEVLDQTLEGFSERLDSMGVLPGLTVPEDISPVYADERYLARILNTLLENALDAMEGVGEPFLELELSDGPDGVLMTITNSSAILPEEWLGEIFDPFFTTKEGCPGLGLAVAQGMVRAHDGRLWAKMPIPGVLSLSMELPREAPDRVREFRAVPLNLSRTRTVLLLDDNEGDREVTKTFLEKVGYNVREAWSGRSALAQITSGQLPEIVITDVKVSDGTGFWFLEQLGRVSPRLMPRTVILVSDSEHEAADGLAKETGCPVIRKPIDPQQLLEVLDQVAMGP